jgi:hypothetical protein
VAAVAAVVVARAAGGAGGSNGSSAGNFVVRVPAAVSAPQSSHGRLRVRVERSAGFADAVEVGLVAPPPGVFANAASTASDEAWLPLQISGTVPLGALESSLSSVGPPARPRTSVPAGRRVGAAGRVRRS